MPPGSCSTATSRPGRNCPPFPTPTFPRSTSHDQRLPDTTLFVQARRACILRSCLRRCHPNAACDRPPPIRAAHRRSAPALSRLQHRAATRPGADDARRLIRRLHLPETAAFDEEHFHEQRDIAPAQSREIGRAHARTQVTNASLVCRLLLEKKKKNK